MSKSTDILQHLFQKHPFIPENLAEIICNSKHCTILLKNGNIGVCSTLGVSLVNDLAVFSNPDFSRIDHRIMINAWVNACTNYTLQPQGEGDIFTAVDFSIYKSTVMVGYFGSLSEKFINKGIDVTIFDLDPTDKPVAPIETQKHHLSKADAVILTATSISNMTFQDLMENTSEKSDVFILGPSTPLDALLLLQPKVKALFGTRFGTNDSNVLEIIRAGGGTKKFLPFIKKVYFYR
jgi:uncharacterized protein (DUF4213/DUF364 family)